MSSIKGLKILLLLLRDCSCADPSRGRLAWALPGAQNIQVLLVIRRQSLKGRGVSIVRYLQLGAAGDVEWNCCQRVVVVVAVVVVDTVVF